jgi:phage terminase small subunit
MTTKPLTAKPKKVKVRVKAGNTQEDAQHRRKVFAEAYLTNGGNAGEAARAAGYSPKTCHAAGSRLLKHVEVLTLVKQRRAEVIEKMELTTERTLREIARLAYVDPRKFFRDDGTPKDITELDDDSAAALAGMEVTEEWTGTGADRVKTGVTKKYKLADKNAALEKAMKHLGQYEKDNQKRSPLDGLPRDVLKLIQERLLGRS